MSSSSAPLCALVYSTVLAKAKLGKVYIQILGRVQISA